MIGRLPHDDFGAAPKVQSYEDIFLKRVLEIHFSEHNSEKLFVDEQNVDYVQLCVKGKYWPSENVWLVPEVRDEWESSKYIKINEIRLVPAFEIRKGDYRIAFSAITKDVDMIVHFRGVDHFDLTLDEVVEREKYSGSPIIQTPISELLRG